MSVSCTTTSEEETEQLGARVGRLLGVGSAVLLYGDLGAGKTAFVRGLVEATGVPKDEVSSPTFAIVQQYAGRPPVLHADLYRLRPAEVPDLGLDELAAPGILVVEWAERLPQRPPDSLEVRLLDRGGDCREVVLTTEGTQLSAALQALAADAHSTR